MATNVGKSNTMTTTDAEILGEAAGMSAGLRTLPLRCYRGLKLHILFEPNAMRQKKKGGRSRRNCKPSLHLLRIMWLVRNADLLGQILCEDHVGRYVFPFLCRWRDGIWEKAKTTGASKLRWLVGENNQNSALNP